MRDELPAALTAAGSSGSGDGATGVHDERDDHTPENTGDEQPERRCLEAALGLLHDDRAAGDRSACPAHAVPENADDADDGDGGQDESSDRAHNAREGHEGREVRASGKELLDVAPAVRGDGSDDCGELHVLLLVRWWAGCPVRVLRSTPAEWDTAR